MPPPANNGSLASGLKGTYEDRYYYNWVYLPVNDVKRSQTSFSYMMYPLIGERSRFYRLNVSGLILNITPAMENQRELTYELESLDVGPVELANGAKVPCF